MGVLKGKRGNKLHLANVYPLVNALQRDTYNWCVAEQRKSYSDGGYLSLAFGKKVSVKSPQSLTFLLWFQRGC